MRPITNWAAFTKHTPDPELAWLERQLDQHHIPHRRLTRSASHHAPILEVPRKYLDAADSILIAHIVAQRELSCRAGRNCCGEGPLLE